MAAGVITIEQTPKSFAPGFNPMVYVISTTTAIDTKTNYSYIADVYLSGAVTKTIRVEVYPDPETDEGKFNVSNIIRTALSSTLYDTTTTAGHNTTEANNLVDYVVKFGEAFDDPTYTIYEDLTVDSSRNAINASLTKRNSIAWDIANYDGTGLANKYLTNSPAKLWTSINDFGVLYFYYNAPTLHKVQYKTYSAAGVLLGTFEAEFTGITDGFYYTPSNPASINLLVLTLGAQPAITAAVSYYTVQIVRGATETYELKTFYIREECDYELLSFAFLNALGGFDKFNFYKRSDTRQNFKRKTFKQEINGLDGAGNWNESLQDRETVSFNISSNEQITVFSDWLTEAEATWLRELVATSELYIQNGAAFEAVGEIRNAFYDMRKKANEKQFLLEFTFNAPYDNYTQTW